MWWPNGYGPQPLYLLAVTLRDDGTRAPMQSIRKLIGFRTIELVRERDARDSSFAGEPTDAESFFFRVNGVPIFAKVSPLHVQLSSSRDRDGDGDRFLP